MLRLILSYITFPGIVAHEFAHAWACRRLGIRVHKVCYLRLGNPMGYVLHEQPQYAFQHIMVAVAPFFVSTALGLAISLAACLLGRSTAYPEIRAAVTLGMIWIGFSCALHAFPSSGDADALWNDVRNSDVGFFAKLLLAPVVGLIRLAQIGARLWLDVLFALAVVALPPVTVLVMMG
jgi:hypothetical protein